MSQDLLSCRWAGLCSGCPWISRPYEAQRQAKMDELVRLWETAGLPTVPLQDLAWRRLAIGGLRDRTDLIYKRHQGELRLGFYAEDRTQILAIDACPQMSPELAAWFEDFRKMPPPIDTGSLRLRVAPDGKRGVWLDFSNQDVKKLLDERKWLTWLSGQAIVEIGQRRKRLAMKGERLGLVDPVLDYWFPTYFGEALQPLYSVIGAFSQVGAIANRALIAELMQSFPPTLEGRWIELGAGAGNLTLPLAFAGKDLVVTALEIDELSLQGLQRAATESGLAGRVEVQRLSFHHPSEPLRRQLAGRSGCLADPPRSGLMRLPELLEEMPATDRPRHFIYVSCFVESLVADAVALYRLGYRLRRIVGIDQFPQTPHAEYVAAFEI